MIFVVATLAIFWLLFAPLLAPWATLSNPVHLVKRISGPFPLLRHCGGKWLQWLSLGIIVSLPGMFLAIAMLCYSLYQSILSFSGSSDDALLVPILPGVNLPGPSIPLYCVALAIHAVWHEAGHAAGAAAEGCRVRGVGWFVWLVYPGAFVDIDEHELAGLTPWRRLRVLCAGAFHNAVLSLVAAGLLWMKASLWLCVGLLLLRTDGQVVDGGALAMSRGDVLSDVFGLHERIVAIDRCAVADAAAFQSCLAERTINGTVPRIEGYRVDSTALQTLLSDPKRDADCCDPTSTIPLQCFDSGDDAICLSSQTYMQWHNGEHCNTTDAQCLRPRFDTAWERLIRIDVVRPSRLSDNHVSSERSVMYRGAAESLWDAIEARDDTARFRGCSNMLYSVGLNVYRIPDLFDDFLYNLASIGVALALFNLAPIYKLDGEYILRAVLELVHGTDVYAPRVLQIGTILAVTSIVASVVSVLVQV